MATGQVFVWPEGSLYLFTGADGASALVAYQTDTQARFTIGSVNYQTFDKVYHNTPTGKLAQITIGHLYTPNQAELDKLISAQTAVHMHFKHIYAIAGGTSASAGYFLWSGFIDAIEVAGREGDLYRNRLQYHCNEWSAY